MPSDHPRTRRGKARRRNRQQENTRRETNSTESSTESEQRRPTETGARVRCGDHRGLGSVSVLRVGRPELSDRRGSGVGDWAFGVDDVLDRGRSPRYHRLRDARPTGNGLRGLATDGWCRRCGGFLWRWVDGRNTAHRGLDGRVRRDCSVREDDPDAARLVPFRSCSEQLEVRALREYVRILFVFSRVCFQIWTQSRSGWNRRSSRN